MWVDTPVTLALQEKANHFADSLTYEQFIIQKTYSSENLPHPLFAKEGQFLPFVKGGKEGFSLQRPNNYGQIGKILFLENGGKII